MFCLNRCNVFSGDSLQSACVCVCVRNDQIYNIDVSDDCKLEIGVFVLETTSSSLNFYRITVCFKLSGGRAWHK